MRGQRLPTLFIDAQRELYDETDRQLPPPLHVYVGLVAEHVGGGRRQVVGGGGGGGDEEAVTALLVERLHLSGAVGEVGGPGVAVVVGGLRGVVVIARGVWEEGSRREGWERW